MAHGTRLLASFISISVPVSEKDGLALKIAAKACWAATAPYAVTSWAPDVVGSDGTTATGSDGINSITFVNGNCADAYIGGDFTSINGTSVKNIAGIDTTTGDVVSTFGHNASGAVQTLLGAEGHILAGGDFKSINNSTADPYMASLNPVTGKNDRAGYANPSVGRPVVGLPRPGRRQLAQAHGETGWRAHALPLSVDGVEMVATLVLLADRRSGHRSGWLPLQL
jgi:hypothetical protein